MIRHTSHGIAFYQFASLAQHTDVLHAVFTRLGGTSSGPFSSLNVGHLVGDRPDAVEENHAMIFRVLGIKSGQVVTARQIHSANVAVVTADRYGTVVSDTDALVTREPGLALLLRFADCLPLLLYDSEHQAVGLAHVGWRGLLRGIIPRTLATMQSALGCDPHDMIAGLGPAIGPCCYEIGSELVSQVERTFATRHGLLLLQLDGRLHFDLPAAARWQLQQLGVQHIEDSGLCTSCHTDEFFSHRAERGHTGRFAVVLALRRTNQDARRTLQSVLPA